MHACIAAISSGVPVYPLAYSRKFNGLFIKTLQYPYVGDLRAMSMDQIMENMQKIYQMRQDIEMEIQHIIETIIVPSKEKLIMDLCTSIVKYDIWFKKIKQYNLCLGCGLCEEIGKASGIKMALDKKDSMNLYILKTYQNQLVSNYRIYVLLLISNVS